MTAAPALRLVDAVESQSLAGSAATALGLAEPGAGQRRYSTLLSALSDRQITEWLNDRWDSDRAVYTFRGSDPCSICAVEGCGKVVRKQRLCYTCAPRFEASGATHSLEWAAEQSRQNPRRSAPERCAIVDRFGRRCARPTKGRSALCNAHSLQRSRHEDLDLAAFGALESVRSFDEPPRCSLVDCSWPSVFKVAAGVQVCEAHYARWRWHRRREPDLRFADWEPSQVPAGLGSLAALARRRRG